VPFARPIFWNVPHWAELTQYVLGALVAIVFLAGLWWRVRKWRLGRPEPGTHSLTERFKRVVIDGLTRRIQSVVKNGLFQWRLSTDPFSIVMHLLIFWGMVVLFIGTAVATIDLDFTHLLFDFQFLTGNVYRLFEFSLDLFGTLLIVGLIMAAYRRFVVRPERLQAAHAPTVSWDSVYLLTILFLIAVTGFVAEGLRIAEGVRIAEQDMSAAPWVQAAGWAPVGFALAGLFGPLSSATIQSLHQVIWWTHALLAFAFIASVPFTKAFHLVSSPLNMFFRNPVPGGRLGPGLESGVEKVNDFTWRQLLQVDSCTWCGKCQDVCPGHASGFPLSPKDIVQKLDGRLIRTAAAESVHGDLIAADELWSCCACRACEEVCPVFIEQPGIIVDMRRHLVYQGEVDEGLQDALMNIQRYGNSFGQSGRKRTEWTKTLDFPVKDARKEEIEYLWFLGDYASYDQRAQDVTRATARVFHQVGLDFGVLAQGEQNAGNDVRRIGEEGLFDLLREKNVKALEKANFQKIVTTDPHTYNTLKNEYTAGESEEEAGAALNGRPVLHYTELFDDLIRRGKLAAERSLGYAATYHDPCYLGRYNGIYDAPRRVIEAMGVKLVEMPRNRSNSFCCGAGGGRIWMKDMPGIDERPAESRIKEALALPGVEYFIVACPKDLAMFQDAVKTVGAEDRLKVVDLGELVLEAIHRSVETEAES